MKNYTFEELLEMEEFEKIYNENCFMLTDCFDSPLCNDCPHQTECKKVLTNFLNTLDN